jgi:hypothetical protein
LSQKDVSKDEIKTEYYNLVKEFHPDKNQNNVLSNDYMMKINYVYEHLLNNQKITIDIENDNETKDEYEQYLENGKYSLINNFGIKEYVKEKPYYIYKLALLEYQKCYKIMFSNSVLFNEGKKEESGYEVIKHLYICYTHIKNVIKIDKNGMYGNMAKILLIKAFKMNKTITKGLRNVNEKGITKRL